MRPLLFSSPIVFCVPYCFLAQAPLVGPLAASFEIASLETQASLIGTLGDVGIFSGDRVGYQLARASAEQSFAFTDGALSLLPMGAQLFGASGDAQAGIPIPERILAAASDYSAGGLSSIMREVRGGAPFALPNIFERGLYVEGDILQNYFKTSADGLGNYPVIDFFEPSSGHIASIKSIDLAAASRIDPRALENVLNRYVDKVSGFQGARREILDLNARQIQSRELVLGIPMGSASSDQLQVLSRVSDYAASRTNPVQFTVFPYR